jgi:carbonic anhydrase/acetyltransferase-like protein (isoleucine patch superfamily)
VNISQLAQSGQLYNGYERIIEDKSTEGLDISPTADFTGKLTISASVHIGEDVAVGSEVVLDDAYLDNGVQVEDEASIEAATILAGALIGRAALLRSGVIVAPGVLIPAGAQIGEQMVISSQRAIAVLGPLGTSNRTMTIHGGPDGPYYSAGCQDSDDSATIEQRIRQHTGTSPESAAHYEQYWDAGVLPAIGAIVQRYYEADERSGLVAALHDRARTARETPST